MKEKNKKLVLFIIILAVALLIPNLAGAETVQATETTSTSTGVKVQWSYELDDSGNITNLKCTNISSVNGNLTIPSKIDGHTVVSIGITNGWGDGAFEDCAGLTGITFPNTITTIGDSAFKNCTGLKSLTLPDSVTGIKNNAFKGCTGLTAITFSKNLTSIGDYAFENCTGLKSLTIPNSVTTIGTSAFEGCSGLKDITLSTKLTKINSRTFCNCSGLTSVVIPDSVTTIDGEYSWEGAFYKCSNLEKVKIPDTVASIGKYAFADCDKLTIYGNDNQVSKSYAEANSINFKYISQWNDSNVGDDITPPTISSITVPYSNVMNYYDSNSTTYTVPSDKVLIINVNFNETILATKVPSLTIKFGSGENIVLSNGTVSGKTIAYTYTVAKTDKGTLTVVSLRGGEVKDAAGNKATLSCPALKVEYVNHYIYANGNAVDIDTNKTNTNTSTNKNNTSNTNTTTNTNTAKNNTSNTNTTTNTVNNNSSNTKSTNTTSNNSASTKNTSTKSSSTNTQKDTTVATSRIPQTGMNYTIAVAIVTVIGIAVYTAIKVKKYKGIK